jgi:hydrogenase nickel incorporation protein HypB
MHKIIGIKMQNVKIEQKILNKNDQKALEIRKLLDDSRVFGINIMASPGAGKTSLIEQTIKSLTNSFHIAVIDGDLASSIDADRASAAGATSVQINTGGQCHLDAFMVEKGLDAINIFDIDLLLVENVGNLICPISFQLGTHKNILISSIPEGDDKPYKYPSTYRCVDILVINKIDLLPFINFDMGYFERGVNALNPGLQTFRISCKTGEGIQEWIEYLRVSILEHKPNN